MGQVSSSKWWENMQTAAYWYERADKEKEQIAELETKLRAAQQSGDVDEVECLTDALCSLHVGYMDCLSTANKLAWYESQGRDL